MKILLLVCWRELAGYKQSAGQECPAYRAEITQYTDRRGFLTQQKEFSEEMDFPSKKIKLVIVTYRDAHQWAIRQKEGSEANYQDLSHQISMAPTDLEVLTISDGDTIRLSAPMGTIVVKVKADANCPPGFGFIPVSSYINKLTEYDPIKAQLPNFKRIEVEAETVEA